VSGCPEAGFRAAVTLVGAVAAGESEGNAPAAAGALPFAPGAAAFAPLAVVVAAGSSTAAAAVLSSSVVRNSGVGFGDFVSGECVPGSRSSVPSANSPINNQIGVFMDAEQEFE
jgi:hypothetical protein